MDYYHLMAGLALARLREDDGSGPVPAVPGHEADRLAARAASARVRHEAVPGRRRRGGLVGRRRGATPVTVT
ncbi:hypothetical protein ACTWP5_13035 [Streptomyces sp. 4N509B]|uniref:hypothetical protein n=1 Tax=Streptomyces sp. 4N509B TaxID=3457413 RepID=UPI003FD353CC